MSNVAQDAVNQALDPMAIRHVFGEPIERGAAACLTQV